MQHINYKLLNGGYYALMIDGEEIGVVYKQEHAAMIEQATIYTPKLELQVSQLSQDLEASERYNKSIENELRKRNNGSV